MTDILTATNDILWGTWTFFLLMGAGLLFTFWTKFIQFKALTHGVQVTRGIYDNPDDPGAINHFQALSAALSATVGLGNIGGVALAIGLGGPGALFWMWVIGFLGMALKTVEITLAMMYRDTTDPDNPHGGAMWVIDKALGSKGGAFKPLAKGLGGFFCVTLLISTITGGNMFQAWNVAALTEQYFQIPGIATSIVMAVVVGLVILGGIKRIGNVAGRIVPFMVIIYLLASFAVIGSHIGELPELFLLVVRSAFSPTEGTGAFVGAGTYFAFTIGLKRALFSNEAGQGSAPIAHSAAKTDWPAREGVVGGLGPFIDTILICTLTALVILTTGTWNRAPEGELGGDVRIMDRGEGTYEISGPMDLAALPPLPGGDIWSGGNTFFMVAEVLGATNESTGDHRVRITGAVVADDAGGLELSWDPLVLSADAWEGAATGVTLVSSGVYRTYAGAPLTALAFDRAFPGLGKWMVTLAAWLFAISTMISWSYYGEQGVIYLVGEKGVLPYKLIFMLSAVVAPLAAGTGEELGALIDFGTGWMLVANMPIVLLMGHLAVRHLEDYFRRLKAGEFPRHDPPTLVDVAEGKDVQK